MISLDVTGSDNHAEGARLRAQGPAMLVALPGEVRARTVSEYEQLRRLLADAVLAENVVHAGQAAWWYSSRMRPRDL